MKSNCKEASKKIPIAAVYSGMVEKNPLTRNIEGVSDPVFSL